MGELLLGAAQAAGWTTGNPSLLIDPSAFHAMTVEEMGVLYKVEQCWVRGPGWCVAYA